VHFSTTQLVRATKEDAKIAKQIKSLAEKGEVESLEQVLSTLQKSAKTYNALIDAHINAGQFDKANDTLTKMKQEEFQPSSSVLASIITSAPNQNAAESLFNSIEEDKRDATIYDALINVYVRLDKNDLALTLLEEEFKKEVKPKQKTISALVSNFCKDGNVDMADKVLRLCTANAIEPGTAAYNAILTGYIKQNMNKQADRLFDMMGPEKNRESFRIMIKADPKNAEKLLPSMIEKFKNDTASVDDVLNAFVEQNMFAQAIELLNDGEKKYNVKLDENNFATVIRGLVRAGKENEAREVYNIIETKGIKPSKGSPSEYAQ
jgi:pentatricopeptide repeat protein